jgi:glycosyltransferase involved in cell wall biosynthesis
MSNVAERPIAGSGRDAATRKIRVLLIAPSLSILGGQAVQATRLIRELNKEPDIEVEFQEIGPPVPGPLGKIKYVRTALSYLQYSLQLLRRMPKYDIIHTFSAGLTSFTLWTIPAVNIARLYRKHFILNYRDGQAEEHLKTSGLAKPSLLKATCVISPSDYVVDVFAKNGIPASRIYNVIDMAPFRYRQRRKLRPVFMTNRILEPLYNIGCILRAFQIVQTKYPDASLTIAHDGPSRAELEALAQELQLKNTQFIGRVPHPKVPDLYDSADVYLTSPNFDCMPGSVLGMLRLGITGGSHQGGWHSVHRDA